MKQRTGENRLKIEYETGRIKREGEENEGKNTVRGRIKRA